MSSENIDKFTLHLVDPEANPESIPDPSLRERATERFKTFIENRIISHFFMTDSPKDEAWRNKF